MRSKTVMIAETLQYHPTKVPNFEDLQWLQPANAFLTGVEERASQVPLKVTSNVVEERASQIPLEIPYIISMSQNENQGRKPKPPSMLDEIVPDTSEETRLGEKMPSMQHIVIPTPDEKKSGSLLSQLTLQTRKVKHSSSCGIMMPKKVINISLIMPFERNFPQFESSLKLFFQNPLL